MNNSVILSVLIPTTPDRVEMFSKLFTELYRQITYLHTVHPTLGKVEVLVDDSKKFLEGGLSIGKKREALMRRAKGKYLCYADSDDYISPNYVETLVRLCQLNRDVCTFKAIAKNEYYWSVIDMSIYHENEEATPDRVTRRNVWHICPIRSEYAKMFTFEDSNYGEDASWLRKVLSRCKSENKSDAILYQYNHGKHSEADKIVNHVQSITGREVHS